jgi:uncharacterized membrane protein YbhN (UPF0104 family)
VRDRRRARAWGAAARFATSALLLWLVFRRLDGGVVLARLTELRPGWVGLGLAITVLQVGVLAMRWRFTAVRLGVALPLREALAEYYLGILVNQVLPGGVLGDLARAWRHARSGAPTGAAVRAVILERASAQVVMTLVAALSAAWVFAGVGVARVASTAALAVAIAAVVAAGARLLGRAAPSDTPIGRLRSDAREALLVRGALAPQVASALVVVASYLAVFVIAARAVGVTAPLGSVLPLVAPILMTMLVPLTVAGWGVREAAAAALWGFVGMTPEDGAAVSVAYGLIVLASSAPGLVPLIASMRGGRGRRARPPRA